MDDNILMYITTNMDADLKYKLLNSKEFKLFIFRVDNDKTQKLWYKNIQHQVYVHNGPTIVLQLNLELN